MKREIRVQRLNHAIAQAVQAFILPDASDERISSLEVAAVDVAGDLHNVTIHLVPGQGQEPRDVEEMKHLLHAAAPWFRRQLTEHVELKKSPVVHLSYIPLARRKSATS
jgi:ribosome-binding factor A